MRTAPKLLAGLLALAMTTFTGAAVGQSAEADDPPSPAYWTATETDAGSFRVPGAEFKNFPWGYRNTIGFSKEVEGDDPRANGELDIVFTYDWSEEDDLGRGIGLARLVNDGGSFEGPVNVIYYPDGSEFRFSVMEGKGGYDGLTYLMSNYIDPLSGGLQQGLIWEGRMPPIPDADLLPD